ncbi:unnamed protein product [Adineta ricciae]|uniref:Uncharacterized protein n=1 Tax=Adineta ricciae TaxID=249248 RepID=A0A815LA83_ADIRI|nr:unnamed protein product [Adineta ricciae]
METGIYNSYQLDSRYENAYCPILCPDVLNTTEANLPHLRTLQLRQIAMNNVIVLIQHVKSMCQLKSLILINCNVKDKNELVAFKSCFTNFMIRLHCLRFVLYLPGETKLENPDLYWFNLSHQTVEYVIDRMMILYTVPYPLNSQRQVYNHTFGRQATINKSIDHIEWIVDRDPLSIDTTLTHFQHVNSLVFSVDIQEMNININSWRLCLPFLHSLKLNFDSNPIKSGLSFYRSTTSNYYRCFILEQFRKCASALECLSLYISNIELLLEHSSSPWPFVWQLNIYIESYRDFPSACFIKQLPTHKAFPQLQYLSFNGRGYSLNRPKSLALQILSCFDALMFSSSKFITLHVNRFCAYHRSQSNSIIIWS